MTDWRTERREMLEGELAKARAASSKDAFDRSAFRERYQREVSFSKTPLVESEIDELELDYYRRSPSRNLSEFLAYLRHLQANDVG